MSGITEKQFIQLMMAYILDPIIDLKLLASKLDEKKIDTYTFGLLSEMEEILSGEIALNNLKIWFRYLATKSIGKRMRFTQSEDGAVQAIPIPFFMKDEEKNHTLAI